jgi:hypothetical protein
VKQCHGFIIIIIIIVVIIIIIIIIIIIFFFIVVAIGRLVSSPTWPFGTRTPSNCCSE